VARLEAVLRVRGGGIDTAARLLACASDGESKRNRGHRAMLGALQRCLGVLEELVARPA
jgi:hypothetical protein